jgi:hypothetical protein
MFKINFAFFLCLLSSSIFAQVSQSSFQSNYNPHDLFAPIEYPVADNITRAVNGSVTTAYWQNKADYNINVRLDEVKKEIAGTVILNYKNNSPHNLSFLWFQMDQQHCPNACSFYFLICQELSHC